MRELNMLRDGMNVERFHTIPSAGRQTVGHHTANVIGLLYLAYVPDLPPEYLLKAALVHDMPEAFTGDTPANVKRVRGLALELDVIEAEYMYGTLWECNVYDNYGDILKVCDRLELVLYLNERIAAGCFNRRVRQMQTNAVLYLHEAFSMVMPGAVKSNLEAMIKEAINEQSES